MKINRIVSIAMLLLVSLSSFVVLAEGPASGVSTGMNATSNNAALGVSAAAGSAAAGSAGSAAASASGQQPRRAKNNTSDANLYGHIVDEEGKHLAYVTIKIKGTTIGARSDNTGHFQIINLPTGKHTVLVNYVGYKPYEKELDFVKGESIELKVELEPANIFTSEVTVTADRYESNRKESSVIVNTINPTTLSATQSTVLSEGLNFCPGLRMENNCQNCGFNQVRMNGMSGPYSQILINSRPIFSGLAGVYGLELIPSNMIDQIEVVRGGGSALYGSNAIAGTINLILKDPVYNYFEAGASSSFVGMGLEGAGDPAMDNNISVNATTVSPDKKMGMSLYGYYRTRDGFDADDDGYSELSTVNNTTFGTRLFYRPTDKSKLAVDFFNINEARRGGDMNFEVPNHEANISEAVDHRITTGALTYTQFLRGADEWAVYVSGQNVNRDSYYGAEKSLKDYGNSTGLTYTIGSTYNAIFDISTIIVGAEVTGDQLMDKKLGYPVIDFDNNTISHKENVTVADQHKLTYGAFGQYELRWDKFKATAGLRYDHYNISDDASKAENKTDISGDVLSPRITLMYNILEDLQVRGSYANGYRAPQIFDEDLHIETSGLHQVTHENAPNLKQETSHSFMGSLDYNTEIGGWYLGFLIEGFYTKLVDPFVSEYIDGETEGSMISYRSNSEDGAQVVGANFELNLMPFREMTVSTGYTYQKSQYEVAQNDFNEKAFYRTPDSYGYMTIDWDPTEKLCLSASGTFTGSMLVPYFGLQDRGIANYNPDDGALIKSDSFIDLGFKASYDFSVASNILQVYAGVKNILNSYQNDFDSGIYRDPGYIYGPGLPRAVYVGFKIKK